MFFDVLLFLSSIFQKNYFKKIVNNKNKNNNLKVKQKAQKIWISGEETTNIDSSEEINEHKNHINLFKQHLIHIWLNHLITKELKPNKSFKLTTVAPNKIFYFTEVSETVYSIDEAWALKELRN